MTRDERNALKALAKRATPGPWFVEAFGDGDGDGDDWCNVMSNAAAPRGLGPISEASPRKEDACFIAAARTAVPALLRDLETAEGLLRRAVEKNGPRAHADLCGVVSDLPCDCWLGAARALLGEKP